MADVSNLFQICDFRGIANFCDVIVSFLNLQFGQCSKPITSVILAVLVSAVLLRVRAALLSSLTSGFCSRIVRRVHVRYSPRSDAVKLNRGCLFRESEVPCPNFHRGKPADKQLCGLGFIEHLSDTHIERTRKHCYVLNTWMPVWRDFVVGGKREPHCKRTRFRRVPLHDCCLCPLRQRRRTF